MARIGDRAAAPRRRAHVRPALRRHARTCSTAVRFGWAGPGARRRYRRVTGPHAGSGHGLWPARRIVVPRRRPWLLRCHPGLVPGSREAFQPPRLSNDPRGRRGADVVSRTASGAFPRIGVRGRPGPRNKSGVTRGGRTRCLPSAQNPRRNSRPDSSGRVPGIHVSPPRDGVRPPQAPPASGRGDGRERSASLPLPRGERVGGPSRANRAFLGVPRAPATPLSGYPYKSLSKGGRDGDALNGAPALDSRSSLHPVRSDFGGKAPAVAETGL